MSRIADIGAEFMRDRLLPARLDRDFSLRELEDAASDAEIGERFLAYCFAREASSRSNEKQQRRPQARGSNSSVQGAVEQFRKSRGVRQNKLLDALFIDYVQRDSEVSDLERVVSDLEQLARDWKAESSTRSANKAGAPPPGKGGRASTRPSSSK